MTFEFVQWLNEEEHGWHRVTLPPMVTRDNFVSGDPEGSRMRIRHFIDGNRQLREKVWFGPGTQGPPGHVHGGSIAAVLDEAMGGAAWLAGHMVVAAEIIVTYQKMLPLETCCVVVSRVTDVQGRKVRTEAEIVDRDGLVYCKASGLFVTIDATKFGGTAERINDMVEGISPSPFFGTARPRRK